MPEFQRQTLPFTHKGMNWNAPPDKIPPGQLPWCKNARVLQQGTISAAHGITQVFSTGDHYFHSISRLNVTNPAFDPNLAKSYVFGTDTEIKAAQDQTTLTSGSLNPLKTPNGQFGIFSGNPLSIVDAQPAGASVAWKYVGDSKQMVTVGYYPTDVKGTTMARALTMGLTPPVMSTAATPVAPPGGTGLTGAYQWIFAFHRIQTGARSNPSAATRASVGQPATNLTNQAASMVLPNCPNDPQTGAPDTNVVVDVYRFGGAVLRWALVGTGPGGSTFVDNVPDIQLLAAPAPPQTTDASTGLTRFNLFRPFVTQDIARTGSGTVTQPFGNGVWVINFSSGANFNVNWLAGSSITIGDTAFTIYQVRSTTQLEIAQDATGSLTAGNTYTWSTPAGTLTMGQPLPHLWGNYGVGQSASYLFACGDPNAPGTLYWTNGNDPDSTDIVNNIIVTSPSEKLQTGACYNGTPFCWSTERQFQIFPSLTVFGQFTSQEVAGAKGCWLEWSLSVQSNGISDQSITWRGEDGLYDWSQGGGLRRLTDDLYPFFPHDNAPGIAPETIMPFLARGAATESVGNLDDTQPKYHRTCWFQGMLFYDFVAQTASGNTFSALAWDDVEVKGWVSVDQLFFTTGQPVARGIEIGGNNLLVSYGGTVYDYFGTTRGFAVHIVTRAEDQGDPRALKLYGDYWLDLTPLAQLTVTPLTNFHRVSLTPNIVNLTTAREELVLDFLDYVANNGIGFLGPTIGLDLQWQAASGQFTSTLNQWGPTVIGKPETIDLRASDKTDDGYVGAKFLRGMVLEANTFNTPYQLAVLVDGTSVAQLTVTHNGQSELPYGWTPAVGYEFQLQMVNVPGTVVAWQNFKVRWVWDKWADYVVINSPFLNLGTSKPKYLRGFSMPVAGPSGTVPQFTVTYDDGQSYGTLETSSNTPADTVKNWGQFSFYPPIVAHQVMLVPIHAIRAWYDEIIWDAEEWPELSVEFGPWTSPANSGQAYLRGINVPVETNGKTARLQVRFDPQGPGANLGSVSTAALVKSVFPLVPPVPLLGHEFQLLTEDPCRVWWNEVKWDFDPWPDLSTEPSAFTDCGYKGAKFMQGCVVPLDTNGQPVQLQVNYDGGVVVLGPITTAAAQKTPVAFSFSPCNPVPSNPFIAHEVQIAPLSAVRVWYDEIKWVWEPEPELVYTWDTQPTTHDLPGYHHLRDCFIAYAQTGGNAPVLTITTDFGQLQYTLDPTTAYLRSYRVLQPQKARWRSYRVESCSGLRLFMKDCEVRAKAWGDTGPFRSFAPFGDLSRSNGGARI